MTTLAMWTVYDHPSDHPDCYIARLFEVDADGARPTESVIIAQNLEVLRAMLVSELHLTCLTRQPDDDPKIVETWV